MKKTYFTHFWETQKTLVQYFFATYQWGENLIQIFPNVSINVC